MVDDPNSWSLKS